MKYYLCNNINNYINIVNLLLYIYWLTAVIATIRGQLFLPDLLNVDP